MATGDLSGMMVTHAYLEEHGISRLRKVVFAPLATCRRRAAGTWHGHRGYIGRSLSTTTNSMPPPESRSWFNRATELFMGFITQSSQLPKRYVTWSGTILTAVLMLGWGALVIVNIVEAWPTSTPAAVDVTVVDTLGQVTPTEIDSLEARVARAATAMVREATEASDTIRVYALVWSTDIVGVSWDTRLLLISLWFGALGSLLHDAGASFATFAGNRQLVASWVPWYIVRPLLGAGLATVFYVVLRAGFATTGGSPVANVSHFTVAAAAALVGLFTQRATVKLREVFDAVFPPREKDQHSDGLAGDESAAPGSRG